MAGSKYTDHSQLQHPEEPEKKENQPKKKHTHKGPPFHVFSWFLKVKVQQCAVSQCQQAIQYLLVKNVQMNVRQLKDFKRAIVLKLTGCCLLHNTSFIQCLLCACGVTRVVSWLLILILPPSLGSTFCCFMDCCK